MNPIRPGTMSQATFERCIEVDNISHKWFNIIKEWIKTDLIPKINPEHSNICISGNNSKTINQYIENLTRTHFPLYLFQRSQNFSVYCGENLADTSLEVDDCFIHLDNKGTEVKPVKKDKFKNDLIKDLLANNISTETELKSKLKSDLINLCKEQNICTTYFTGELEEPRGGDHPDENLHFKSSQSNLSGFTGPANGEQVTFEGKMPSTLDKPHLTFILKHVYSEEGLLKFVLYSIPHCVYQPIVYGDIQQGSNGKNRTPKAKDEFRFNMNRNGEPYRFLEVNEPRYCAFEL